MFKRKYETLWSSSSRSVNAWRKLRQDWAGGLRDYRDQYTALELQRKALDWRDQ